MSSRATVDFPQPLSPTIPKVSPGYTEKDTSLTAEKVLANRLFSPDTL